MLVTLISADFGQGYELVPVNKRFAARGAYRKGEVIQESGLRVVARRAVYAPGGQYRIRLFTILADSL